MNKNYFYCAAFLLLMYSCNNTTIATNQESSASENKESLSTEQKFCGEWVVITSKGKLEALTGQRNISKGKLFDITKNDDKYLLVKKDFEIVKQGLVQQDENTLIGVNSDDSTTRLKYDLTSDHLTLEMPDEEMELERVK
ncbi:hypothetical protein [Pedobacter ghigonis]|uniref:hypothetical protein n=1 Tax=Pedobacter ghigonis TaxID=2730403 RepID=UPI00158AF0D1|nr:hypothetical protein [Pedobacter ghigonis]